MGENRQKPPPGPDSGEGASMKLVSWNVNGLRACLGKGFLDFCAFADADVICLQETKMRPEQAEFDLPGYERYWNSADKAGYSGTAVFTRQTPLSVTYDFGKEVHRHEGRVITAEYPEFYLVCCYTPNSKDQLSRLDYRMEWEDDLRAYLLELDGNKVSNVRFIGGCSGNTQGVARLAEGMDVDELISRLQGIRCGSKPTSCPDQLAKALLAAKEQQNG